MRAAKARACLTDLAGQRHGRQLGLADRVRSGLAVAEPLVDLGKVRQRRHQLRLRRCTQPMHRATMSGVWAALS